MPDSQIRQIVDAVAAQVALITSVQEQGTKLKHWAEVALFPAAFTYFAGEVKTMRPTRSVESDAVVGIYTVVAGGGDPSGQDDPLRSFLELYRQIVLNIEDDPTLGLGSVQSAMVTEAVPMVTSETIAKGLHVADVLVSVRYRHERGVP